MRGQMAQAPARGTAPRLPIAWAAALVLAVLLAVSAARLAGYSPVQDLGAAEVLQSRLIRFDSTAESVAVVDTQTGAVLAQTGQEGFISGVLRGLKRMRQAEQAGMAEAYRLERMSNGQLRLVDTVSGVKLDLAAYGQSNAAVFAKFLSPTGDKS